MESREQIEQILRWSLGHMPDGERVVLHLGLGALLSLAVAVLIARVWRRAKAPSADITPWDQRVLQWMHAHARPGWTRLAGFLAHLGSPHMIVALALGGAVSGIFVMPIRGAAWTLPVAILGAGLLIQGLKMAFRRPRPTLFQPLLAETGYSFPSGHSLIAMVVYGLLGYFVLRFIPLADEQWSVVLATLGLIGLIGASRVYVGVHYPTDVLAGWAAGLPWLLACLWLHEVLAHEWSQAGQPVFDFHLGLLTVPF